MSIQRVRRTVNRTAAKIVTFAEKDLTPFSKYYQSSRARAVGNGVKVTSVKEDTETDFTMEYVPDPIRMQVENG